MKFPKIENSEHVVSWLVAGSNEEDMSQILDKIFRPEWLLLWRELTLKNWPFNDCIFMPRFTIIRVDLQTDTA